MARFSRELAGKSECETLNRDICSNYGSDTYADRDGSWNGGESLSQILSAFYGQSALDTHWKDKHKKEERVPHFHNAGVARSLNDSFPLTCCL